MPTLPLPEVTPENNMIPDWRSGYPVANSVAAWHYNRDLVMPMVQLSQAVQNETLDYELQMKLAAVVSARNGCRYCLCSSAKTLNADGSEDSLMIALQGNLVYSGFTPKERAALLFAEKLTTQPSAAANLVASMLDAGWTNDEVAQIIFFVSHMNMMNRIAQAFHLPPDASHPYDVELKGPMVRCE
jgi:AhpD family alkylhydroperoxidase